jgi:hypothetical protein
LSIQNHVCAGTNGGQLCFHLPDSVQIEARRTPLTIPLCKSLLNDTPQLSARAWELFQGRKFPSDSSGRRMIKVRSHGSQDS